MKIFFWGFFSTPLKRLLRTISMILTVIVSYVFLSDSSNEDIIISCIVLISIPILSYVIEPFVSQKKTREKGKSLLAELKEMGPDHSMAGNNVVKINNSEEEYDEPLSESRKWRKTKIELLKEFPQKK